MVVAVSKSRTYGGAGNDYFGNYACVFVDGDYVYAIGYTDSEGQGGSDYLIVKFNKSDLTIAARKVYGGAGDDFPNGVFVEGDYVYAVGYTDSEGEGGYDCLVFKATKLDIPTGNSVPAGFVCADSALTLADSALTLADSGLILADSGLTLADSALTLSAPYVIPPPLATPTVTTDPATDLGAVSATTNGTLDDDGGEPCDCGFEYGLDITYGMTTPVQNKTTGQTFSQVIRGLFPGTTYHFRAKATNSEGTGYGADRTLNTKPIISRAYALAREEL